jgi:hypothetical protein
MPLADEAIDVRRNAVRKACTRAGGSLNEAQWANHAPGLTYQDTCADH